MYNGILAVNKEQGYTSFDVVAKLRGICGQKKIGHTGTLDPDAAGVLLICLGNATKITGMLTESDKTYETVLLLGKETDTQDISGVVLCECPVNTTETAVIQAIQSFRGESEQIPPMYSALRVNGKRLYELAREGKTVERKPRRINVLEIEILHIELPRVRIRFRCSKGTYIRTLCHDIGQMLGCGGCMESLIRTETAGFAIEQTRTLSQIQQAKDEGKLESLILPVDSVFAAFPRIQTTNNTDRFLKNGNSLPKSGTETEQFLTDGCKVRVYDSTGRFLAIYRYDGKSDSFSPVKMFLP